MGIEGPNTAFWTRDKKIRKVFENRLNEFKKEMKTEIVKAIIFLRENNNTIPSDIIEFMKEASFKALEDM